MKSTAKAAKSFAMLFRIWVINGISGTTPYAKSRLLFQRRNKKYRPELAEKQRFLLTFRAHSTIFFFAFCETFPRSNPPPLSFFRSRSFWLEQARVSFYHRRPSGEKPIIPTHTHCRGGHSFSLFPLANLPGLSLSSGPGATTGSG